MNAMLRSMKWLLLFSGILFACVGIFMLFMPLTSMIVLAIILGIGMFMSGIAEMATFFNEEKGYRSALLLASGVLSMLIGIWTLFGSGVDELAAVIPYVFAVWIMTCSITRIANAESLQMDGFSFWGETLTFGVLGAMFGFLLLFSPMLSGAMISILFAAIFISHGIGNIILFYRIYKIGHYIHYQLEVEGVE